MRRPLTLALWLGLLAVPASAFAQQPNNVVLHEGSTKQLTPHVWAIYGNPNIAIIVGSKATLVVDTGLGPRNGAFIAGEVSRLRKSTKLFLTTTHAHAEHSSGQGGFPAETVVIRPKAQQQELDETGASGIENFRSRNSTNRELLADARVGKSDVPNGDMLTFVEPDGVLVSGDVVQNKAGIGLSGSRSTIRSWLAVLDKVAPLEPALILPDHSQPGEGKLIAEQRAFLIDLQDRMQALKSERKSAAEAARLISAEFQAKYAGWTRLNFLERSVADTFDRTQ